MYGDKINISFDIGNFDTATNEDWVGIYPDDVITNVTSTDWQYVCGGRTVCDKAVESGTVSFSTKLHSGKWKAWYLRGDGVSRKLKTSVTFTISGFSCQEPTADMKVSSSTHLPATGTINISKLAFGSCIKPATYESPIFWRDVRDFQPDLWLWLGDNMYGDEKGGGINLKSKRENYNLVRDEPSYNSHGLIKPGAKIPVMATWDDHDYGYENSGNEYLCPKQSQNEFVNHFNLPSSDPRHKDYPGGQQKGVYNAKMFPQKGQHNNTVQVIMLDARTGRDPTYPQFGNCKGANSRMLSEKQWKWLDGQLEQKSTVKIIASGIQVLQPTNLKWAQPLFCADDSHSGGGTSSFIDSIKAIGEDWLWKGTKYESWGEMPQERLKLLGKAQKAINDDKTKAVIFVSGDQHWGELMAKRMPKSKRFGRSQVLYEVTSSGIYQHWKSMDRNSNRLRDRSCDRKGFGPHNQACVFPWIYKGRKFWNCAQPDGDAPWCSTKTDVFDNHVTGNWGYCGPLKDELAHKTFSNSSKTCAGSKYGVCEAAANYGTIEFDFQNQKVKMAVRFPEENEEISHTISY